MNLNTHIKAINTHCLCSLEAETTTNFISYHCPYYENEHRILLTSIRDFESSLLDPNESNITKTLLYGNPNLTEAQNIHIL